MRQGSGKYAFFFWLTFTIILFLNLLVWLYLKQIENRFHSQLEAHLHDVSQVMNKLIDEYNYSVDITQLIPGDNRSLNYLYFQQPLEDLRLKSNLQSILLLNTQGEILVASPQTIEKQRISATVLNIDFQESLAGRIVVSEVKEFAGEYFMSAYAPIKNIDDFLVAVLVIEAKADFFTVLANLENRLLLFSLINISVILIIAMLLYRMIQRSMRFQAELREQEHLVQLGTMAASVAHELRNPLGIIKGSNDVIRKKYATIDDEIFSYIPDEIGRLNRLIDDFLTFSRSPKLDIQKLELEKFMDHILLNISEADQKRIQINPLPHISVNTDIQLLEQALLNIILNALQADDDGGLVRITMEKFRKKQIRLLVDDSGPGISKELESKIFNPFYTTKEKGTGLGLAITRRIIQQLSGTIRYENRENGARFIIEIPSFK